MAGRRADYGSISPSVGPERGAARRGRSRLAPWVASLALVLLATALVALLAHSQQEWGVTALLKEQKARGAARGRGRQNRLAKAATYGVSPGNFEKLGVAGAAAGVGSWLVNAFPTEFLNSQQPEAHAGNQTADPEDCDCAEVRHCFICLKDDALFEKHRHDEANDGGEAEEHSDRKPEEHAHADAGHLGGKAKFDKQMLRFAVSELSGDGEGHGDGGHSLHEEYHPVEFFHYRPNCCEFPMKDKVDNPDTSFDEPCYWDEEELGVKDWGAYGHPVVCTKSDFKEAHTLVNTLSTWAVAAICLLWMIGLVFLHETINKCWHSGHAGHGHGGHGDDHDDHGDEMKSDHDGKKQGPSSDNAGAFWKSGQKDATTIV